MRPKYKAVLLCKRPKGHTKEMMQSKGRVQKSFYLIDNSKAAVPGAVCAFNRGNELVSVTSATYAKSGMRVQRYILLTKHKHETMNQEEKQRYGREQERGTRTPPTRTHGNRNSETKDTETQNRRRKLLLSILENLPTFGLLFLSVSYIMLFLISKNIFFSGKVMSGNLKCLCTDSVMHKSACREKYLPKCVAQESVTTVFNTHNAITVLKKSLVVMYLYAFPV